MKRETYANKLNELLGIAEKVEEKKTRSTGKVVGITEEEIQESREAQGLMYFLAAPELFTSKICPHCKEPFVVSRKYVAYCSYTCIRASLAEQGIKWRKGEDLEALANDPQVFNGNEPIWVRKKSLEKLKVILENLSENLEGMELKSTSKNPLWSEPEPTSLDTSSLPNKQSSLSVPSTTEQKETSSAKSPRKKKPKRKVTFTD